MLELLIITVALFRNVVSFSPFGFIDCPPIQLQYSKLLNSNHFVNRLYFDSLSNIQNGTQLYLNKKIGFLYEFDTYSQITRYLHFLTLTPDSKLLLQRLQITVLLVFIMEIPCLQIFLQ